GQTRIQLRSAVGETHGDPRAQPSAAETAGVVLQAGTHASCGLGNRLQDGVEATSVFGEDVITGDNGYARHEVVDESVDSPPSALESEDRRQKKPSDVDPQPNPVLIGLCDAGLSSTVVGSCHSTKGPF